MGGEFRHDDFPQLGNEFPRGQFFFDGRFTNTITPTSATAATQSGGYAGADLMMGAMYDSRIAVALVSSKFTNNEWAAYLDDTWRVTPHLTVSPGLRWEVAQPMLDTSGHEVNVQIRAALSPTANVQDINQHPVYVRTGTGDFYEGVAFRYKAAWQATGANLPGAIPLQTVRDGRMGDRMIDTNYKNFAPRLGIAWSPSDKWSIRTGFGIFYSEESKNSIFDLNRGLGGRTGTTAQTTYEVPKITYKNFIDTASLPVTLQIGLTWGAAQHLPTTYSMQYLLNIQRTLGKSTTLEVGYNGASGRHLADLINMNQPVPGTAAAVTRLPYPEFGTAGIQFLHADGTSSYNGVSAKLSQRFGTNLTTLVAYTFSKALDDISAIRGPGNDFSPENALCPHTCEWGPATFNVKHRFVTSLLYTLPFGKGQKFLNKGGIANEVVGGWQVSTITTIQSGVSTESSSWDAAGVGFQPPGSRLNCTGLDPVLPNANQNGWFNAAAFTNPLPGTFGNCGRNNLVAPHQVNIDFSLVKTFRIAEQKSLEFRTEMFNAPNHVELGTPAASWNGSSAPAVPSNFGVITSTVAKMRQIQFALKFNF
jgi:hypothetical protein